MGFRSLQHLPVVEMEFDLIKKLLHNFDVNSCSILGVNIKAGDVGRILGVPAGGKPIPTSISNEEENKFKAKFGGKVLPKLTSELKVLKKTDLNFKKTFMLFASIYQRNSQWKAVQSSLDFTFCSRI